MKCSPFFRSLVVVTGLVAIVALVCLPSRLTFAAQSQRVRFQRPSRGEPSQQAFRRPSAKPSGPSTAEKPKSNAKNMLPVAKLPSKQRQTVVEEKRKASRTKTTVKRRKANRDSQVQRVAHEQLAPASESSDESILLEPESFAQPPIIEDGCPHCMGDCTCDVEGPSCDLYEPGCGIIEPGCGCVEPSCGCYEPGCGLCEPSCGCGDTQCGGGVGCGSCVARPGPDYWCFPICLPRFKDLSVWAGVHGFRGPRDFMPQGRSDSNFGFQEGINISGRAPLVGLLFPQLSYQLGYQAVQSRLDGTVMTTDDRSQQFVTGGFFRRVKTGLQFGVVWDLMRDDLDADVDLHQIRTEISLKSPRGREIGFWSTTGTNDSPVLGTFYAAVDQYALFYRGHFGNGYECRFWGGATGEGEALFGGEFYAPLNDRWSVQSVFNYLNPDTDLSPDAVHQESWNVGINLIWHLGNTARRGCGSPFRPLFSVADNGWMFVDQAP